MTCPPDPSRRAPTALRLVPRYIGTPPGHNGPQNGAQDVEATRLGLWLALLALDIAAWAGITWTLWKWLG